jgi:hypothetical protein
LNQTPALGGGVECHKNGHSGGAISVSTVLPGWSDPLKTGDDSLMITLWIQAEQVLGVQHSSSASFAKQLRSPTNPNNVSAQINTLRNLATARTVAATNLTVK